MPGQRRRSPKKTAPPARPSTGGSRPKDAQDLLGNAAVKADAGRTASDNLDALATGYGAASSVLRGAEWLGDAALKRGLGAAHAGLLSQVGGAASVLRVAGGGAKVLSAVLDEEAPASDRILDGIQGSADMVSGLAYPNVAVSGPAAALSAGISIGRAGDEAARETGLFHDDRGRPISASEFAAQGAFDAREAVRRWTGSEALGETAGALAFLPYTVAGALGGTGALIGKTAAQGTMLAEDLYRRFFGGDERKAGRAARP